MRLPGTVNLINNELPTPHFLRQYARQKAKQRALEAEKEADRAKRKAEKAANAWPHCKAHQAAAETAKVESAKAGSAKDRDAKGKDGKEGGVEFTKEQDILLVELKVKRTAWKAIATELGKEVHEVKERFKIVRPADFEKRMQEAQKAKNEASGKGKASAAEGKGREKTASMGAGGDAAEGSKKQALEKEQGNEAGDWWKDEDANWGKDELQALLLIANEELKEAFARMALRLAEEKDKRVHPASIAAKVLGRKPDWA